MNKKHYPTQSPSPPPKDLGKKWDETSYSHSPSLSHSHPDSELDPELKAILQEIVALISQCVKPWRFIRTEERQKFYTLKRRIYYWLNELDISPSPPRICELDVSPSSMEIDEFL